MTPEGPGRWWIVDGLILDWGGGLMAKKLGWLLLVLLLLVLVVEEA